MRRTTIPVLPPSQLSHCSHISQPSHCSHISQSSHPLSSQKFPNFLRLFLLFRDKSVNFAVLQRKM